MPGNRTRNPRGAGRSFNQGPRNPPPFGPNRDLMASTKPLMANHLQLSDLDLELALLKRKREMIEKQHNLLVSDSHFTGPSPFAFDQGSQSFGRSEPTHDFANLYNDPPERQYGRFPQQGLKRPAIDPWDHSAPKRFNAPGPGPRKSPSRYNDRPARSQPSSQPPPLMSSSYRPRRPAQQPSRSTFKPTKVTKTRQNAAPNKLNSYPVEERKSLVDKASRLVQQPPAEMFIYNGETAPHPKLLGRLELALGIILREMKEQHGAVGPHVVTFTNMAGQRAIKQAIRERIRAVMLGKHVGAGAAVVALYRKEHPQDTDEELLDKARESIVQKSDLAIEIIKQVNPERYFKSNFRRLLEVSLTEMFDRLQKLYTNVEENKKPLQEAIDRMLMDIEKDLLNTKEDPKLDSDEMTNETEPAKTTDVEETGDKSDENGAVQEKVPQTEEVSAITEENTEAAEETVPKPEELSAIPEENIDNSVDDSTNTDQTADASESKVNGDAAEKAATDETKDDLNNTPKLVAGSDDFVRARFYNRLFDYMMRRHLPVVLPKYREQIMKILNTDKMFKETKAYIIKTTEEKAEERVKKQSGSADTVRAPRETEYFVKVIGRPSLPKKKVMKAFLDTFQPTLIKKHRNMHNVLFVSFNSKENYDNILTHNGSTLASSQLEIKVSEKVNKNKPENQKENDAENKVNDDKQEGNDPGQKENNGELNKLNESDVEMAETSNVDIQLHSLDDQIDDLLTSIRQEEENKDISEEGNPETDNADNVNQGESEYQGEPDGQGESEYQGEPEGQGEAEGQNNEQGSLEHAPDNQDEAIQEDNASSEINETAESKEEPQVDQKVVEAVKSNSPAKATPTRSSARVAATPSNVRTRRTSKLTQNN